MAVVSMLISSVASLIDTIVVSAFMGPVVLSAVNICMPIYSILTAVSFLIIGGAGTIYGKQLGADPAKEEFFNMSLSYGRELFKKGLLIEVERPSYLRA